SQGLLQLVQQAVGLERRLRIGPGQQLVQDRVRDAGSFASGHREPPSGPLWPPHTKFPTVSWPAPGSSAAAGSYGSFDAHPIGEGTSNQASSMILARSSGHNLSHRPLKTASF